jgi:hypothetical protein
LFYVETTAGGERIMAVPISINGAKLEAGTPVSLFSSPPAPRLEYAPSSDGQRFLLDPLGADSSPVTLILNWKAPKGGISESERD